VWPPQLSALKERLKVTDSRDDVVLARDLAAAVAYVQRELSGDFDFSGDDDDLPAPDADVHEGTVRYAMRLHSRTRSPDGLVIDGGELGSARVPTVDADIERLLGVGRFRRPMV